MKNTLRVFGIIALVAVIGFSMAACGDDDSGGGNDITILNGTWNKLPYQIIITGKNWTIKRDNEYLAKGTGTINATQKLFTLIITHFWQSSNWQELTPEQAGSNITSTVQYNLTGNSMVFSNNTNEGGMPLNGTWTK